MLCGNSPACDNWSMNYVISYEESARTLVQGAVQRTSASLMEWQSSGFYERPEAFVVDTSECLASIHGRPVDCRPLLAKFGESVEDATLAGLLKRLDGMLQSQKAAFGENEVGILSTFIGKEIVKRTRSEGAGLVAR